MTSIRIVARQIMAACACLPVLLLNLASGQEKVFPVGEGVISVMAISPKGDMLAIDAFDFMAGEPFVVLFDIKTEKKTAVFRFGRGVGIQGLAFQKDSKTLMSFSGKALGNDEIGALVRFWDIESGQLEAARTFLAKGQGMTLTDRWIVTRVWPGRDIVNIFDLEDRKQIAALKGFPSMVEKAALSPDGKHLATYENDGPVKLFELPSTKCLYTFNYPKYRFRRMMFLQNEPTLAVLLPGLALYDLKTGKIEKGTSFFPAIAISPDGKMMAYEGQVFQPDGKTEKRFPNALHILSSEKKKIIASFIVDPQWRFRQMQFTPDNRSLIAAGDRGIVRVWDVSKLEP